ncbi:uncharacterized protein EDB93DRAFT_1094220, partial [Suillus bovinus]|uniref:uncharacterized protein n=1 Tax=Suillus bovinus TaxID=48563 RepID=UPI001B866D61
HRALKAFYLLTNKLDMPGQLAKHEHRRHVLRRVAEAGGSVPSASNQSHADTPPSLKIHHHISNSQNNPVRLFTFLQENEGDPAIKNFILKLRDHILYRLQGLDISYCDHTFTDEE